MTKQHISLPKSSLLRFSNSGVFHYLDLSANAIVKSSAKSYNTGANYYPQGIEKLLSDNIETQLGKLNTALHELRSNSKQFGFSADALKKVFIECVVIQWLRIMRANTEIQKASLFGSILPTEFFSPLHHLEYNDCVAIGHDILSNSLINYDFCLGFIPEGNPSSFLLNTTHFVSFGSSILFVLSPQVCLHCMPQSSNFDVSNKDNGVIIQYEEAVVDSMIPHFIRIEQNYGDGHLIGYKNQLLKAQKFIKENDGKESTR